MDNFKKINIKEFKPGEVIVALDVGDRTIGVAVSDRSLFIASPVTILIRKYLKYDCEALLKIFAKYKIGAVVFGWPVKMDGTKSSQCEKVEDFINAFSAYFKGNFFFCDERFSTKIVEDVMIAADLSRKRRKQVVDKVAAVYILQGVLDTLNIKPKM